MTPHPQIHMIVPVAHLAGRHALGVVTPAFCMTVQCPAKLFRLAVLARLLELHATGRLALLRGPYGLRRKVSSPPHRAAAEEELVATPNHRLAGQRGARYLSRYTHRVAISTAG